MKKTFYIIPGYGHNTQRGCYRELAQMARKKGYKVINKNPRWKKTLSSQIFPVAKNDVIFGFSLGAVLAFMVGQKYHCSKLFLASMTPINQYSEKFIAKLLRSKVMAADIKSISSKKPRAKIIKFYGDLEKQKGDIIIKNTGHRLARNYSQIITKYL